MTVRASGVGKLIKDRQNDERGLLLNKAANAAHRSAQKVEWLRYAPSLALAATAVVLACLQKTSQILIVAGFAWALISVLLLSPLAKLRCGEAAKLQEHFDTYVFCMDWAERESKADPERIRELASKFKGDADKLRDYYADVSDFPPVVAVLLSQRSNVTWDMRLRLRWKNSVTAFLISWLSFGIALGLLGNLSTMNLLLRWYAPSLAVISLAWEIIHSQRQTIADRAAVKARITSELEWASLQPSGRQQEKMIKSCRKIQDEIFAVRSKATRVPKFLYDRYRETDDSRMKDTIEDMRKEFATS
ncbi:S-4TM family putative pore-forming effector [Streptomyces acidiscabies]|uniref:S-4TM family putative pore-forming effector n=1 Tax=Streptomyces acidiscabies TaxID=42234 RepID=UPI0030CDDA6A